MWESWGVRGGGIFCGCRERLRVVKGRNSLFLGFGDSLDDIAGKTSLLNNM